MKTLLAVTLLCCSLEIAHPGDLNAPFTVAVVPSRSSTDERSIASAAKKPETFYVVLTNVSDHAQSVWQTQCSWGFWTISFDITMPDGKHLHISRNHNEVFTKNSPAIFLVPAGQHQVYPIQFDSTWDHLPSFTAAGSAHVTLKAIYEVGSTPEAAQKYIWVGRVESPNYDLVLRHW